ncbi:MAG: elongation factor P [Spongiibacteraceae bacterium]
MKTALECRAGQVILISDSPWIILKAEYTKSGRNTAIVKMKLRNLLTGAPTETVYKADDKFDTAVLEKKDVTYSYFTDPAYIFVDEEYNQYELSEDDLGDMLAYIEDGMTDICALTFFDDKPISLTPPKSVIRKIEYSEPAARGDTSGKVMKLARLMNGHELQVAAFCETGDSVEIDTATNEYKSRIKG